jgi:hypothetical protein
MHKIFLISGIIVAVLAIIGFSQFFKDVDENPEIEIKTAPVHEVEVMIAESYPEQIIVYIKGGLPDGCTEFNDLVTEINGNTVNITVTIKRPKDAVCPAIYGYFEKNVNIGSNFIRGQSYTVNVNGVTAEFTYPPHPSDESMQVRLAPIHEIEISIAKSNPEQIILYIKGGLADGCTTLREISNQSPFCFSQ